MPRYKLTLEYDGAGFLGWQKTAEGPSVQSVLERAAKALFGQEVEAIGAGRTDSGVHALGQVAHLDAPKALRADKVRDAMNAHLRPDPAAVLAAEIVDDSFHARFSAIGRVYWYRIVNRRPDLTLDRGRAWRVPARLESGRMHEAAQRLLGEHDFSTFRDSQCQAASPIKTLDRCDVVQAGEEIHIWCAARSFLHRQVRSMVGSLVEVGWGKWTPEDLQAALQAADRARCGPVAPAEGLYLAQVRY